MSGVEIALIVLITIWSIIFIAIGVAVLFVVFSIKRALNKVDRILDRTEELANKADLPSKMVTGALMGFMAKNGYSAVKNLISSVLSFKGKKD